VTLIGILTLLCFICASRVILGVHGIDQVLFGGTLGLWMVFTYYFILFPYIDSHFGHLKRQTSDVRRGLGFVTLFIVCLEIILCVSYAVVDTNFKLPGTWHLQIIDTCGREVNQNKMFQRKQFLEGN
jgi:hypothetical protein